MSGLTVVQGNDTSESLFAELLKIIKSYPIATVFGYNVDGITSVVHSEDYHPMIRFYIFSKSHSPVGEIVYPGKSLLLRKDHSRQGYPTFIDLEGVNQVMESLIRQAKDRRNTTCVSQTGVEYKDMDKILEVRP